MTAFEREGLVTKFGDLEQLATDAYGLATGATLEEIHEFHDREPVEDAEEGWSLPPWPDPANFSMQHA